MIRALLLAAILMTCAASIARAQNTCTLPFLLQNNTTADATQVMSNFTTLQGCVNTVLGLPQILSPVHVAVSKVGLDTNVCTVSSTPCLTIAAALAQGLKFDVSGGVLFIDFQGSGNWAESVQVVNQLRGGGNAAAIPNIGSTWPAMVILNGNGSGNTTISGNGSVCYTLAAANYGILGVENLTLTATATGCQVEAIAQLGGQIDFFGGVVFSASNSNIIQCEDSGSAIEFWQNYTITGSAPHFAAFGSECNIKINAGVGTLTGTPAYSQGFLFGYASGNIQWNIATPWTGAATGPRFKLLSNASVETNADTSVIPGNSAGFVSSGGHYHGPLVATIGSSSGLGTGSASLTAGATPEVGEIMLAPTGSPSGSGTQNVTFPYDVVLSSGNLGFCTATPNNDGTGSWAAGTFIGTKYGPTGAFAVNWTNGTAPTNLTAGQTYGITYICSGN